MIENTILNYDNDINKVISIINQKLDERFDQMNDKIELKVNGRRIPLTDFPNTFIKNTLFGMIKSLKGIKNVIGETIERSKNINIHTKLSMIGISFISFIIGCIYPISNHATGN